MDVALIIFFLLFVPMMTFLLVSIVVLLPVMLRLIRSISSEHEAKAKLWDAQATQWMIANLRSGLGLTENQMKELIRREQGELKPSTKIVPICQGQQKPGNGGNGGKSG